MVKIVIAGGSGSVAREVIDVLLASKKHEITVLSRRAVSASADSSPIHTLQTSYEDVDELVQILDGAHTVLSFIAPHLDQEEAANTQKRLIDASIKAGVKRFAPSEWSSSHFKHLSWYTYKAMTREYLATINKDGKVLEYCLFQPGLFTNYLATPYKTAKYLDMFGTPYNFNERKALLVEGGDESVITFTTVKDFAQVVARAVEYEGVWPVVGGMAGTQITIGSLVALGEKVRGGAFEITRLKAEDLKNGTWTSPWLPKVEHPSIAPEHVEAASKMMVPHLLLAFKDGSFTCSDEWNKLLPDYHFEQADDFAQREWRGKP
ncbi:hypothetical protein DE146DRAFT_760194 [Phaeosphaeria sp. MPI-PUGE-AT-0046c]|nr:hypothetical protein DE146DRAFT_760194 [Phaeosphaeria sp. MPI-PUGE-AT-0046c]